MKLIWTAFLVVLMVAIAEPRVQLRRGLTSVDNTDVAGKHPYLFLTVPRGRSGSSIQGFEVLKENDADDDDNDEVSNDDDSAEIANDDADDDAAADDDEDDSADDDDDDNDDDGISDFAQQGSFRAALSEDELDDDDDDDDDDNENDNGIAIGNDNQEKNSDGNKKANNNAMPSIDKKTPSTSTSPVVSNLQMILQNAKPTQMMVSKEHAGAIMVPDGIIEIEGQSVIDEKTGKAALLVPRSALEAIPDGSVVALMERSAGALSDEEEERANRVIVRRRRRGSRRNVRRRTNGNRNRNRNRNRNGNRNRNVYRNGNRRRRVNVNGNRNRYNQRRRVNRRKNVRVIQNRPNRNNNRRRQNNRRRVNRPYAYQV